MTAPTTSRPAGRSRTEPRGKDRNGARSARIVLSKVFASHSPNFYLLFGTTLFLVLFGLTMVLSSSSVTSYVRSDDSFGGFFRQGGFALLGVPLMLVVSRVPIRFWKKATPLLLGAGCVLQLLVLFSPLGWEVGGNRNWLRIGGFTMQPSEIIKLALALWLGVVTTTVAYLLFGWGLARLTAVTVSTLTLAEPLAATLLGLFVLHEHLTPVSAIGLALIAVGLAVVSVPSRRRQEVPDATAPA